jgi:hypothetical protein
MTETSPQHDPDVMTVSAGARYSQRAMNGLQHTNAFVVQLRAGTDFERGRVEGRVEHIASGRTGRFGSAAELLELLAGLLKPSMSLPQAQKAEGNREDA